MSIKGREKSSELGAGLEFSWNKDIPIGSSYFRAGMESRQVQTSVCSLHQVCTCVRGGDTVMGICHTVQVDRPVG